MHAMTTDSIITDAHGAVFVSIAEAGRRLGISRGSAYALVAQGELETIQYGSRRLVPVASLLQLAGRLLAGEYVPPPSTAAYKVTNPRKRSSSSTDHDAPAA